MSVVPFARCRFTPDDIGLFREVAGPKLERGQWAVVERASGRDFDSLLVHLPRGNGPVFRFSRDFQGRYHLSFNDRSGWQAIGTGASAAECLAIWRPRSRLPARSAVS